MSPVLPRSHSNPKDLSSSHFPESTMRAPIDSPVPQVIFGNKGRTTSVLCSTTGRTYPSPSSFDDVRCNDNFRLFADAPWLDRDSLVDQALLSRYATDGCLPGDIPLRSISSRAWNDSCCSSPSDSLVSGNRTVAVVRIDLNKAVY